MAKQLKKEAITEIKNNSKLFQTVCDLLDVKPGGLMSNLNRNSERLTQHEVLIAIAAEMGLAPVEIIEEEFAKAV
jgi:pyrroline-5-carboxylate reductase